MELTKLITGALSAELLTPTYNGGDGDGDGDGDMFVFSVE
jgi:hypothetical protein